MMEKITTLLVDDENNSRVVMKNLISSFCPQVEVLGEAASAEEAFRLAEQLNPDLVFLDIQMPNGNGFTLLQRYESVPFEVIFITSYDQFAINAIRFNALDYLLKPVVIEELKEAVSKAVDRISNHDRSTAGLKNLTDNLKLEGTARKIALHKHEKVHLIAISEISHIRSDGNYSMIHTGTGEQYTSSKTLKDYHDFLSEISGFIRIHKNCLINIRFLKSYSKGEPCIVTMENGEMMEISRRKKQEVLEAMRLSGIRI